MPNHVENDFFVKGIKTDLIKFKKFAQDKDSLLSANKFIPYPKKYKDLDDKRAIIDKKRTEFINANVTKIGLETARKKAWEKFPSIKDGFNSGGYDWCCNNWGTKWGMYDASIVTESKDTIQYFFRSAWSPPIKVIEKMSKMFPSIEFTLYFFECGAQFAGVLKMKNKKVLKNEVTKYTGTRGG